MKPLQFASAPMAWLALLYCIGQWMWREGRVAAGQALEQDQSAAAIFSLFPQTDSPLAQEFARTLLTYLMADALECDDIETYARAFLQHRSAPGSEDQRLLRLIQGFITGIKVSNLRFATEFVRLSLPCEHQIAQSEMEESLQQARTAFRQFLKEKL